LLAKSKTNIRERKEEVRMSAHSGEHWTKAEDERLRREFGLDIEEISKQHGRSEWAIRCRLQKLTGLKLAEQKPVEPKVRLKPDKFWMIIRFEGPGCEKTSWRHPSELEARTEAAKLASKLGAPMVVLEAQSICYPRPADAIWEEL